MSGDQEMMELIELFVRARNQEFATTFRNPNWLAGADPCSLGSAISRRDLWELTLIPVGLWPRSAHHARNKTSHSTTANPPQN